MKTKNITPSNVPTTPATVSGFTLGLDLGDRQHHVCVLDAAGNIVREAALPNTRPALAQLLVEFPKATVALEAGTHSPWISRYLTEQGATVLVAKEREKRAPSPASWTRSSKESSRLRGNTEQPTTNNQQPTFNIQRSTFNVQGDGRAGFTGCSMLKVECFFQTGQMRGRNAPTSMEFHTAGLAGRSAKNSEAFAAGHAGYL
jgi:hypothetical protein